MNTLSGHAGNRSLRFSKKPAFHAAGVIEEAPCQVHINPFRAERIVFHADGLLHGCHDQVSVERDGRRFYIDITPGRFSITKMIAVELCGFFGLPDLPVGNVFPGVKILQE